MANTNSNHEYVYDIYKGYVLYKKWYIGVYKMIYKKYGIILDIRKYVGDERYMKTCI